MHEHTLSLQAISISIQCDELVAGDSLGDAKEQRSLPSDFRGVWAIPMGVCPFSRVCFTSNNHQSLRVAYQKAAEGSEKSEKSPYLLQGRSQQLNDKREAARTR